jgi:hypothetical protein
MCATNPASPQLDMLTLRLELTVGGRLVVGLGSGGTYCRPTMLGGWHNRGEAAMTFWQRDYSVQAAWWLQCGAT